jgi:hypothetical protein
LATGQYYVWDANSNCSGQCLTGVQHLTGAPSSKTPLLAGDAVGPTTPQGTAIATGWEKNGSGQLIYPSKPARLSNNHAAIFVAPAGSHEMRILSQWVGAPLHVDTVPRDGWNVITSRLPPAQVSTSELRSWGP